ncbi:hypothetical protein OS493_037179, partial [Desmophyllum pertusum]
LYAISWQLRGLGLDGNLTPKEIEKFPKLKELNDFWGASRFNDFLCRFKDILSSPPKRRKQEDVYIQGIIENLPLLSELADGRPNRWECTFSDTGVLSPVRHYTKTTTCTTSGLYYSGVLQFHATKWSLKFSAGVLSKAIDHEEQTFKVEEELRLEFQKQSGSPDSGYTLQRISLEFMDKRTCMKEAISMSSPSKDNPGVCGTVAEEDFTTPD